MFLGLLVLDNKVRALCCAVDGSSDVVKSQVNPSLDGPQANGFGSNGLDMPVRVEVARAWHHHSCPGVDSEERRRPSSATQTEVAVLWIHLEVRRAGCIRAGDLPVTQGDITTVGSAKAHHLVKAQWVGVLGARLLP